MNRIAKEPAFILLILILLPPLLFSGTTGKIAGIVTDADTGEPLPGANVIINGSVMGAATNLNGEYTILQVPPGIYSVTVSMIGYAKMTIQEIRVQIDQTARVDFSISSEALEGETITVVAEKKLVKNDVATSVASFSGEEVNDMPMANVSDVVGLQAGVEGNLSIRGGDASDALFQVNGITMRDSRTNQPITGIALSAVQEVSVERGGFNAEYGQVRSGIVNVVTKEGESDAYNGTLTIRYLPPTKKHFGISPFDENSMWLRPYLDPDVCWEGTQNGNWDYFTQRQYPQFDGWNAVSERRYTEDDDPSNNLSPAALQRLFTWQHRRQPVNDQPDYNIDAGFGGPVPLVGKLLGNMRFFTSFRNEREMYVIPLTRDDYFDYDWSLQLTSDISESMKLRIFALTGKSYNIALNGTEQAYSTHYIRSPYSIAAAMNQNTQIAGRIFGNAYYSLADVSHFSVSVKLTHTLSRKTFYEASVEHVYRDYNTRPRAARDTTKQFEIIDGYFVDEAPFGFSSLPETAVGDGMFFGGHTSTARDMSHNSSTTLKFDLTSQLNFSHLIKTGFEFVYNDLALDYGVVNLFFPESNAYTKIHENPYRGAFYIQDKMEAKGFIVNAGLRLDFSNANTDWVNVSMFDKTFFSGNYNPDQTYSTEKAEMDVSLSPRLSISHPISVNSKLFFNYGHFKQLPSYEQIFLQSRRATNAISRFGNPNLALSKTISYELGFDQLLFDQYLIQLAAFYNDITDQTAYVSYQSADQSVAYTQITNNNYEDIRGFEVTLRKSAGRWWDGFLNYTYRVSTSGNFGKPSVFQSRADQVDYDRRHPQANYQNRPIPQPFARGSFSFFTPKSFGPEIMGVRPLESLRTTLLAEWSSGWWGEWNPNNIAGVTANVHYTDWYNFILRVNKTFHFKPMDVTFFVEVNNLLNTRHLNTESFYDYNDYQDYFNSLHLPEDEAYNNIVGDDRPGQYRKPGVDYQPIVQIGNTSDNVTLYDGAIYYVKTSGKYMENINGQWVEVGRSRMNKILDNKAYIDMPNMSSFNFLSPRQIIFGIRTSF